MKSRGAPPAPPVPRGVVPHASPTAGAANSKVRHPVERALGSVVPAHGAGGGVDVWSPGALMFQAGLGPWGPQIKGRPNPVSVVSRAVYDKAEQIKNEQFNKTFNA
jgi:hypothetical protein